tara:strand:+ start:912 stop:1295 length:384 start_codon:yes stop_codon:yes gene_type:complete
MKELINFPTMIRFLIFFLSFFVLINVSCDSAEASTSSDKDAINAFKKVGSKDKKLFTQKDRVASYKSSLETGKSSLNKKQVYNGYGSNSKKTNSKKLTKEKKKTKSKYTLKKGKNRSLNNFSAYTTN